MPILINPQIIPHSIIDPYLLNLINRKKLSKQLFTQEPEIKIVYFGTPQLSAYILEQLIESFSNPAQDLSFKLEGGALNRPKFIIQTVVTSKDKPAGRKQVLISSPVSQVAQKYQIPLLKPDKLTDEFVKNHLPLLDCDLFIVVAYGKIMASQLLDIPKLGSINVHYSLLPKYRGASPIQEAILQGDKQSGISIMLMNQKMDQGPILRQKLIDISDKDTYQTLGAKMTHLAVPFLISTLEDFLAGKITPKPQDENQSSYCRSGGKSTLVGKEDGYFDINNPPEPKVLDRMIRAYYPWPGVWTRWNEKIVKFYPEGLVQMEGKKPIPIKQFLNGYPDFPIKNL